MVEKVPHASKVGVWCGVSRTRVFGPFFFTARQTINEERYRTLILEPFVAELSEDEIEFSLFQQDGATAHTARGSLRFLEEIFADRMISESEGMWLARSPGLTLLDFWLWDELKENVYADDPQTLDHQKCIEAKYNLIVNHDLPSLRSNFNFIPTPH